MNISYYLLNLLNFSKNSNYLVAIIWFILFPQVSNIENEWHVAMKNYKLFIYSKERETKVISCWKEMIEKEKN